MFPNQADNLASPIAPLLSALLVRLVPVGIDTDTDTRHGRRCLCRCCFPVLTLLLPPFPSPPRRSLTFCALLFLVFLTLELDNNDNFSPRTILAPLIALYALILVFLPLLLLVTRHYVRVRARPTLTFPLSKAVSPTSGENRKVTAWCDGCARQHFAGGVVWWDHAASRVCSRSPLGSYCTRSDASRIQRTLFPCG